MPSSDRSVLCVPRLAVAEIDRFTVNHWSVLGRLLAEHICEFVPKHLVDPPHATAPNALEVAQRYKQVIPYTVVANATGESVFAYRRRSREAGLDGRWSIGIGGHVEREDAHGTMRPVDAVRRCRYRELKEELGLSWTSMLDTRHLGLINDESDEVGRRHLGVASVVYLADDTPYRLDPNEVAAEAWLRWEHLPRGQMESWSEVLAAQPAELIAR